MENNSTISVWLIIDTGINMGKIALQKRSADDSFPFICQATWAGKVEQGEEVADAIKRECREELGDSFADNFNFLKLKLVCKDNVTWEGKDWECYNYFGTIDQETLNLVKMHDEAHGDFVIVDNKSEIYPVKSGKDPKNSVVLFNDQYEVLKNILNNGN